MERYFEAEKSAWTRFQGSRQQIIRLLADRYRMENPKTPYVWRTFDERGIMANRKGMYLFDFALRFPQAKVGQRAIAMGDLPCPREKDSHFLLYCKNPVKVYLNGEMVFASAGVKERSGDGDRFFVHLKEGMNRFLLVAEKTKIGFYCALQNAMPQWEPCHYVMPFDERKGEAGFVYRLLEEDEPLHPKALAEAKKENAVWYPEMLKEPFSETGLFLAAAKADEAALSALKGRKLDGCSVFVDEMGFGWEKQTETEHLLIVFGEIKKIHALLDGLEIATPFPVQGACTPYLICGPMSKKECIPFGRVDYREGKALVWRPALQHMALRPYAEAFLYGRWTYPLGVTLYGMLKAAERLQDDEMKKYVLGHVKQVTGIHEYALYDTEKYGFAGVNQQICWLDALDDCGSFGALLLRCDPRAENPDVRKMANRIAAYMMQEQPCTNAGAFCRRDDTIWADDMYMSVPFLCRYGEMTGDNAPIDFAAKQMLLFRELLFMPEKGLMAHMRCMIHDQHNGIPWSRGNGWVIFSLSELLGVLPPEHPKRRALLEFFTELTTGYLAQQDPTGLWHQILDDKDSYLESSATAMFICAFARGIRNGWYTTALAEKAGAAAKKAWDGLAKYAVDGEGNLYGVCRGSSFSFSRQYYRGLSWNFNDTHGIGIVMLAGVELMDL